MKQPVNFSALPIGATFRWLNPPRLADYLIDYPLVKGSPSSCGPTHAEQIWDLSPSDQVQPVLPIQP